MKLAERKTSCGPHETEARLYEKGAARAVIVQLHPGYMRVRLKGCRRELVISYEAIYWHAARLTADAEKRDRKKARTQ